MLWNNVDKLWKDRLGKTSEGDISWKTEQWPVPGGDPLEVRVCERKGVPLSKYADLTDEVKTSITLHLTAGYGTFQCLMGAGEGSANILLGRCGTPYVLVPTQFRSWHTSRYNHHSIGIEIDNIANLNKSGKNLASCYGNGRNDIYCSLDDKDVYLEKNFRGIQYWATMTEAQYVGLGRVIKALCFKHKIPRIILPEPQRYDAFKPQEEGSFHGILTHININPGNRVDIGPYIDWAKVIQYAGLTEADCFHPPATVMDTWQNAGGGGAVAPAKQDDGKGAGKGTDSGKEASGGTPSASGGTPSASGGTPSASGGPKPPAGGETLPAPVMVDNHTLRIHVGHRGGRICFSVKQPGDPMPTTPDPGEAPAAKAPGKRDEFVQACMNFLGAPYKAGSKKPGEGIDGANLIAIAMRRVGLFKTDEETPTDAEHLSALWHAMSGNAKEVPPEILPGDLAWFGKGDHDHDPLQHPMVYLGGGRVLGPIPDGGPDNGAVQVIAAEKVPESFGGWMHVDDFGAETSHTGHPGDPPAAGAKMTGALLPAAPSAKYDALKKLVERAKGKWEDGKEKINLVGVKNLHDRCLISPKPDDWNDTLFAAFLDKDGHKCALEMRASLNPGNDSNKTETWQLWEGSWKFKLGAGEGADKALQPDGKVKGWFDQTGMGSPRPTDHGVEVPADQVQPGAPKGDGKDKPASTKPPIDAPKPDKPPPPPGSAFVFDATAKKLSMKFGLRMMRALLEWELKEGGAGTIYSWNGVVAKYPQLAPKRGSEWPIVDPLMQITPGDTITFEGQQRGVWHAFGVEWVATGATNCCNSQMAAVFASLPDGKMRIKKDDGLLELDVVKGTPAAPGIKNRAPGTKNEIGYSSVFANAWIQAEGSKILLDNGKRVFGGYAYIAPAWAMKWLGVGDAVGKWGEEAALIKVRMGDNACWFSHNWLVGDIRYEVTIKGRKTPIYVDQSDFARGERPQPLAKNEGGYMMTKEDCLWVEQNEEAFEARLKAFLEGKTIEFEGKDCDVDKITAMAARVFSANCMAWEKWGTARGVIYMKADGTDGSKPEHWSVDEGRTKASKLHLGISRPWGKFKDNKRNGEYCYGFARWYDNAGGASFKPEGGTDPKLDVKPPADGATHG